QDEFSDQWLMGDDENVSLDSLDYLTGYESDPSATADGISEPANATSEPVQASGPTGREAAGVDGWHLPDLDEPSAFLDEPSAFLDEPSAFLDEPSAPHTASEPAPNEFSIVPGSITDFETAPDRRQTDLTPPPPPPTADDALPAPPRSLTELAARATPSDDDSVALPPPPISAPIGQAADPAPFVDSVANDPEGPPSDVANFGADDFEAFDEVEAFDSESPATGMDSDNEFEPGLADAPLSDFESEDVNLTLPDLQGPEGPRGPQAETLLEILGLPAGSSWTDIRNAHQSLIHDHDANDDTDPSRVALGRAIRREMNTAYAALRLMAVD
ncbi:MAG: hypothetical protein ACI8TP_004097, partial [Acidimicrobiales bacterium]